MDRGVVLTKPAADVVVAAAQSWELHKGRLVRPGARSRLGSEGEQARITSSTADGDGTYPGKVVYRDVDTAAWVDVDSTVTIRILPLNGEVLTSGSRHGVRPIGHTTAGDPLFVITGAVVGITAIEAWVDGDDPTVTGVNTFWFDHQDGFRVSEVSAGIAQIDMVAATHDQAGILSLSAQMMGAGLKTFVDGVVHNGGQAYGTKSPAGTGLPDYYLYQYALPGEFSLAKVGGGGNDEVLEFTYNNAASGTQNTEYGLRLTSADAYFRVYHNVTDGASQLILQVNDTILSQLQVIVRDDGTSDLSIYGGLGAHTIGMRTGIPTQFYLDGFNGVTGTLGISAEVKGGIITTLGTPLSGFTGTVP